MNNPSWLDQKKRVFQGNTLLQIAMPLGGIGTGCICLNGVGGLQDFSIRHSPTLSAMPDKHMPLDSGFAVLHLPENKDTRLVEGPFPPEKIYNLGLKSQGYNGGGCEGLPRFRNCSFEGAFPFGQVKLSDPEFSLDVEITGFNPFIPLDDVNSGIPCAILEYTLHNPGSQPVAYQFSYHLSHLAQKNAEIAARSAPLPGLGVSYWNETPTDSPAHASAALGILTGDPIVKARWMRGGWFDPVSALWRELSTGNFQPGDALPADNRPAYNGGSVLVKGELAPGARIIYPVVITWYFPNIGETNSKSCCAADNEKPQLVWHPFYSTKWKDATDILFYVRDRYEYLKTQTLNFKKALISSSLPISVLDAVSANLAIIKSPTVIRYENGDMWCWEGCFCDKGCCPGSCTHVLNYAQSIPHLFPSLERTLRNAELDKSMDERGHVNFRAALPGLPTSHDFHAAADGQLGGLMKLYRDWQICGDREWLKKMYPLARQSMKFCIELWDPRHVGLTEEPHHNTYDIEFWGPDGLCSSMYLGALKAMIELAHDSDNHPDAAEFEGLLQAGLENIEQRLFNGEYYQQEIMVNQLTDNSFVQKIADLQEDMSEEAFLLKTEGPKYQVGTGCLSDGVFGAWLAKACGLESLQNQDSIRSHLAAVYKYNFKSSLWSHTNPQRPGYALGDESGLLLCTWPRGNKPTLPFVYSDEVWTGIEYQVASHMISLGMVEEGLTIVESVRSRYDGRTRNPWNEYECGSYYARAMASFGVLIALSGFRYSAATHSLYISPTIEQDNFTCFFSTASGWGVFTLTEHNLTIDLTSGELFIENLFVTIHGQTISLHPEVTVHAGEKTTIDLNGGNS